MDSENTERTGIVTRLAFRARGSTVRIFDMGGRCGHWGGMRRVRFTDVGRRGDHGIVVFRCMSGGRPHLPLSSSRTFTSYAVGRAGRGGRTDERGV
jgi:hypothetical protein